MIEFINMGERETQLSATKRLAEQEFITSVLMTAILDLEPPCRRIVAQRLMEVVRDGRKLRGQKPEDLAALSRIQGFAKQISPRNVFVQPVSTLHRFVDKVRSGIHIPLIQRTL